MNRGTKDTNVHTSSSGLRKSSTAVMRANVNTLCTMVRASRASMMAAVSVLHGVVRLFHTEGREGRGKGEEVHVIRKPTPVAGAIAAVNENQSVKNG